MKDSYVFKSTTMYYKGEKGVNTRWTFITTEDNVKVQELPSCVTSKEKISEGSSLNLSHPHPEKRYVGKSMSPRRVHHQRKLCVNPQQDCSRSTVYPSSLTFLFRPRIHWRQWLDVHCLVKVSDRYRSWRLYQSEYILSSSVLNQIDVNCSSLFTQTTRKSVWDDVKDPKQRQTRKVEIYLHNQS